MAKKPINKRSGKYSIESLVLGILSVIFALAFFLLIPGKPFGINILQTMDAREDFTKYVFFLFLIMLMGVATLGSAAVSIVYGIKDFIGSYRGVYISKGKGIYLAGAVLGILTIVSFIVFIILLNTL